MEQQKQKKNYQKELDRILQNLEREGRRPSLLLHSCCAPCSSYVLEYLSRYFDITLLYYNPNIYPPEEYQERVLEQQRLIREMEEDQSLGGRVRFLEGTYRPEDFYQKVRGHEGDREGGERCFLCYEMRLREAASMAAAGGFDYFTTTLSISPLKNAQKLNEIGLRLSEEWKVPYLVSDFKKKNGYRRSTELSGKYSLYRQNYCGCIFSRNQRMEEEKKRLESGKAQGKIQEENM